MYKVKELVGTLDIYSYLQPSNDLYLKIPAEPAGVFRYNVNMQRLDNTSVNDLVYPFVWKNDGPVELTEYFGY